MLVGAHVSVAGGLHKSIDRGEAIGAQVIQSFASSPRSMKYVPYSDNDVDLYLQKKSFSKVKLHVFHGVYLINLSHESKDYVKVCVDSLNYYQKLAGQIGGMGTVFHIGSHKGRGLEAVMGQVTEAIGEVVSNTPDGVALYLENAAGQRGVIGQSIEELSQIIKRIEDKGVDATKLKVCIDTQHAFASGYDLRIKQGVDKLVDDVDRFMGFDKLKLLHVNDSMVEFDSKRDRHANLGEGEIGKEGIARVINHPKLKGLPIVLEVPGENKSGPRKSDVQKLREMKK